MFSIIRKMSQQKHGLMLKEILETFEKFAPLSLAESWDNVGLLVDPIVNKPIQCMLLTNDLTEDVVQEAVDTKCGLIVSYHPNIFQALKSVGSLTWKERVVVNCIKNEIAVFSPHTTWDSVDGGVNDWLAKAFQYCEKKPIQPNLLNSNFGSGRFLTLTQPITLKLAIDLIKKHINLPHLRLAIGRNKNLDSLIRIVALCAGSGASILNGTEADLYLTGEMLHHDVLNATQNGISVILCNHSDSERGYLKEFKEKLQQEILGDSVNVIISKLDRDPLCTV